jgi:hypothetical protein
MSTSVVLTEDDLEAIRVAVVALEEHTDFIPHDTYTWQERDRAFKQLSVLLERVS